MFLSLNKRLASFCYNGAEIELIPEKMIPVGDGVFEYLTAEGLCARLSVEKISDHAFSLLLAFEQRCGCCSGQISRVRTLDVALCTQKPLIWRSFKGDSCGAESFNPVECTIADGENHHVEPMGGRPSNTTGFPFFDVTDDERTVAVGIGWSGQWTLDISSGKGAGRLQAGLLDADFYLKPGEAVRAARVLCVEGKDSASARRAFRQVMFDRFNPAVCYDRPVEIPMALQPFDRYFYNEAVPWYLNGRPDWATEEGQKKCVDAAKACGFDTLWLDAAWFKDGFPYGVGNYSFEKGFPRGLKPVTDYAHEKDLRFVLWFEPERIDCHSETFRDHRDMLLSCENGGDNYLFNLADDRARAWLKDTLIHFIADNGIDVYRQDFNFEPLPYWRAADEPGRKGMTEMRYVAGHYDLWDSLLAAFPNLLIDNCASGGRRIDLETCSRAFMLWRSDTGCGPETDEKRVHTWSQNQTMALTQFIPYHSCATWEPVPYDVRSVFTGGIACTFDVLNESFDRLTATALMDECRSMRRYWTGVFHPLTAIDNSESIWAAWQLDCGGEGAVYAFRRPDCAEKELEAPLYGIDPEAEYDVTIRDEALTERKLCLKGEQFVRMTLTADQPRASIIVTYKKK